MGKFKLRSATAEQDPLMIYFDESQEDWISLRPSMPRKDFYRIAGKTTSTEVEERILVSVDSLFTALLVDWSVVDEKDKKVAPSLEALERLDLEFQTWIDRNIQEQFTKFVNGTLPDAEGKSETPLETLDSEETSVPI